MNGIADDGQAGEAQRGKDFDRLWNYGKPAETGEKFRELLPAARAREDPDHLAQLLTQIARTHSLQMQFDEAHALLDFVEETLTDDLAIARIRYLLERGRTYRSSGDPGRSRPLFLDAWEFGRKAGADFHAVDAAHMLEIVSEGEEKFTWNDAACELAELSSDERARKWLSSLYNNRGFSLHELGRYEEALTVFEKRAAFLETIDGPADQIDIAKWSIAKTLRLLDRAEEAIPIQAALLEQDPDGGYNHEEMAECLLALGRKTEARPHFARAHALLSEDPWLVKNEAERLERLRQLSEDN